MDPYQIIQNPFVTEKTMNLLAENKLEFIVLRTANKPQIKAAVEALLEARVVQVRTYIDKTGKHAIVKFGPEHNVEDLATRIGVF
ncbi:MAG: 50S ribosomal protein L23 [Thermoplasmata archaeon]|nr:50S ribosomal protein L23 [Thermoplasmata archaeon]NIS13841.1 50S ribosomal protein L23 [Thermoplasmata archaeon]NIS21688.1 50S ribosomal protein L23 [Thermoplasmata archaeon]NIT79283.1 50S ribosomal protein L23 [Thermoplasmata archaeon]NIU50721.1 50S ribosomal protein L23 [Thermoplasmata archaeon]